MKYVRFKVNDDSDKINYVKRDLSFVVSYDSLKF